MRIVFVGLSDVPYLRRAVDMRLSSFMRVFSSDGYKVDVLNRFSSKSKLSNLELIFNSNVSIQTIFSKNYRNKFLAFLKIILSYPLELFKIITMNRKMNIDVINLYSGHFFEFIHYYIISRLTSSKVIYHYVEMRSQIHRVGFYHKVNGYLCDRFGYLFFDGVISISHYIDNHLKSIKHDVNSIIIPPICDFNSFRLNPNNNLTKPYVLFCGSAGYSEVIEFIVDSYRYSNLVGVYNLVLILSGTESERKAIDEKTKLYKGIVILHDLSYKDLFIKYSSAEALLIPIRDSIQDIARFPNKICEYVASRGIIISTDIGEISYYFKDGKNSLLSDDYSVNSYSKILNNLLNLSSNERNKIKSESFNMGLMNFDLNGISQKVIKFTTRVVNLK